MAVTAGAISAIVRGEKYFEPVVQVRVVVWPWASCVWAVAVAVRNVGALVAWSALRAQVLEMKSIVAPGTGQAERFK
jgi:hypothetical protein